VTRALYALNQETSEVLLLLAHPAKTESGDTTVRGAGELSADLDVLWKIQRRTKHIRSAHCEKDRDPDLENSGFSFSIEPHKAGTRLVRHQPHEETGTAEAAILTALKSSPSGLKRSDLVLEVRESCNMSRATTYNTIATLTADGILSETDHRVSLVIES
jgi:hypothetical protein